MVKYMKRYCLKVSIYLSKMILSTLKNMIIVFIGTEKIQLLKYGYQYKIKTLIIY